MAGMKRFVTYIYSYEEGKKVSNIGFAKIEIRGRDGRMEIHLRGAYPGRVKAKVYFFMVDLGDMLGISMGEMQLQNGMGNCAAAFKVENIQGTTVDFPEIEGLILIGDEQQIYMSRWVEGEPLEVCMEHFREWENSASDEKTEIQQEDISTDNRNGEMQQEVIPADNRHGEIQSQSKEQEETVTATELPMRNIYPRYEWQDIWERLRAGHENFSLYQREEIPCVKIELKDIRELPHRLWYLGNNSFLLHGFFNYHYLVVGKIGQERWFLGVPGIYQNQERVMAAIFGFPEFLPEPVENQFGYWYRVIEE